MHIGKEGNSLDESRADLQTEPERQLEYGDSEYQDSLVIPTQQLTEMTGYNPRTIRRIKAGAMRPSDAKFQLLLSHEQDR